MAETSSLPVAGPYQTFTLVHLLAPEYLFPILPWLFTSQSHNPPSLLNIGTVKEELALSWGVGTT